MKRIAILYFLVIGMLSSITSCISDNSSTPKSRYTFLNRRQAVLVANSETGEMYRIILKPDGTYKWDKLGSPLEAK